MGTVMGSSSLPRWLVRFTLEEPTSMDFVVDMAGGMRARRAESVAARRSEAKDSTSALESVEMHDERGNAWRIQHRHWHCPH
jgi:hypothetical protein